MLFLWLVMASCFGMGLYGVLGGVTEIPTRKTSRMTLSAGRLRGVKRSYSLDAFLTVIAKRLEHRVKLGPVQKAQIQIALDAGGQQISPEMYLLKACIKAALVPIVCLPVLVMAPIFIPVAVVLALLVFLSSYYTLLDQVKKRRRAIELELPRFTASLAQSLQNSRDVLGLLTSYRKIAGPDLGKELDTTIAEMRTGNYEQALIHLESRVGSTFLSDLIRGLIGAMRGDDQAVYFQMLAFDMRKLEQEEIKKEAAKRPKQIQRYSMYMLLCILIIYGVVLGLEIVQSIGIFFS